MNKNRKIVLDTLNEQNIEYEMFEHQAVYTVDEIEDSDLWNHENGIGAKNLFLRDGSGKHHFLVIIREDKQADLKKVRDEIGSSRLSFASAERLTRFFYFHSFYSLSYLLLSACCINLVPFIML